MVINDHIFALLVGVGDYRKQSLSNLSTYKMDLLLMGAALVNGLRIPPDNIRTMSGAENDGNVAAKDFARAFAEFNSLLNDEDIFILYFSGHGIETEIIFSDVAVSLPSVLKSLERLPSKSNLLVLDCCYSGSFGTLSTNKLTLDETLSSFIGHGTAVMASSSKDEQSRLGPGDNHSMFTGAVSTTISTTKKVRQGKTTFEDLCEGTKYLVEAWNRKKPGNEQHPIFRKNMAGTLFFNVEDYVAYALNGINYKADNYQVIEVKPLSSLNIKRLCAFVIIEDDVSFEEIATITKEIVSRIKDADVYSTVYSEARFSGTSARAIWCYFGHNIEDIVNHTYFVYSVWADSSVLKKQYYKEKKTTVIDDICINENTSYALIKSLQVSKQSRSDFINENRTLLYEMISMADWFLADLQEVANGTILKAELKVKYGNWARQVRKRYLELTDFDVAPIDLHDWSEEILSLAGWVLDLALIVEKKDQELGEWEMWLLKDAGKKYHQSLERLVELEKDMDL